MHLLKNLIPSGNYGTTEPKHDKFGVEVGQELPCTYVCSIVCKSEITNMVMAKTLRLHPATLTYCIHNLYLSSELFIEIK
jgi:hypothetical protein